MHRIPTYSNILGRLISTSTTSRTSGKISVLSADTEDRSDVTIKPEGWDAAKPYHSIPGPKGLPLIGNIWRFFPVIGDLYGLHILEINKLFYKKYQLISRLGGISLPDTVMIYSPRDIEYLFRNEGVYPLRDSVSKSFAYYRKNVRSDIFQDATGVSEVQGKEWYDVRSKVNPIVMHPQTVLQYIPDMDTIANDLIRKMRHSANSNPSREMPYDFSSHLYAWTLESILFVCLDRQLGCLALNLSEDSESSKLITAIIEIFGLFYKIEFEPTIRNIYKTKTWRRYVQLMDFITFTMLKHIEESIIKINTDKHNLKEDTTILQQLLKYNKNMAVATAIDLLTGGVDTTGKVMGSGLYYLAKNPKAQDSLRNELFYLLPKKDSPITKEVLSKASYLKAVIKEITRLAPIAIGNTRQTVKDMVICGYQIPKGTNVLTSNLTLSHSEEHYVQANKFIPERWLRATTGELSSKSTNPFVTLPFGFGPRACLGKRLANIELEVGISKVIRNFYLEWHHKDVTFKGTPFYGIVDPLKLRIIEVEK